MSKSYAPINSYKEINKDNDKIEVYLGGIQNESVKAKQFELGNFKKNAVRAVILDGDYNVAIIYSSKENYYKIPGGGVEDGEDITTALRREIQEEAGVDIEIISYVGYILEQDTDGNTIQKNIGYLCNLKGNKNKPKFTQEEKSMGFELKRIKINEAINIIESNKTKNYRGYFMQSRDLKFLKEAVKHLNL